VPTRSPKNRWADIKGRLRVLDREELVAVVGGLYRASGDIRRLLHLRLLGPASEIEHYREMIQYAVYPDPFSKRPIQLGEAKRLIGEYSRSTDDPAGTLDLTLTFIEAGTEQAADLAIGDDGYLTSICTALEAAEKLIRKAPLDLMQDAAKRLSRIAKRAAATGCGDCAADVSARVSDRLSRRHTRRSTVT
jgi:hypothetical protein